MLIPVIVCPVGIQIALAIVPVEVRALGLTLKRFRIHTCGPLCAVATTHCI